MKKIFLIDDHPLIIESLKLLLEQEEDLLVCGYSTDSLHVQDDIKKTQPDIAIVDVSMPEVDGFDLVPQLKSNFPDLKIIIYTMHALDRYFQFFNENNVDGYVLKSGEYGNIIEAIRCVQKGDKFIPQQENLDQFKLEENQIQFSRDEERIIDCLINNLSNQEIGQRLNMDSEKIMKIRRKMLLKSGCSSTSELLNKVARS